MQLSLLSLDSLLSKTANGARIAAFGTQKQEREIIGMVFFFVLAAYLVLGIVVLYQSYQYAFPKTKLSPNKTLPILVIADGVLAVVAAIFAILAIVVDNSVIPAWWGVLAGVFFVDGFVNACMLVPVLKSHYFMPKLEADK